MSQYRWSKYDNQPKPDPKEQTKSPTPLKSTWRENVSFWFSERQETISGLLIWAVILGGLAVALPQYAAYQKANNPQPQTQQPLDTSKMTDEELEQLEADYYDSMIEGMENDDPCAASICR